jgi:hypothetical protein
MVGVLRLIHRQYIFVFPLILFAFCQIIGSMCGLPDMSVAHEGGISEKGNIACPMDGALACPPSLTSSPERQIKIITVADVYAAQIFATGATTPLSPPVQPNVSVGNAYSIVPITIASSVLRI